MLVVGKEMLTGPIGNSIVVIGGDGMEFSGTDIVGKRFGKLVVEKFLRRELYGKIYRGHRHFIYHYLCRCDCGREVEVVRPNLIHNQHTTSCGCLKRRTGNSSPCWGGHGEISGRLWAHIKIHAQKRNLPFNITIEDAWEQFQKQGGHCALTGMPLVPDTLKNKYSNRSASLDRIDNTKGYEKDNIQWVHKDINWMKGRFPLARFIELCCAVAEQAKKGYPPC